MKRVWPVVLVLLNFVCCTQDQQEVNLDLIPVMSGGKWGYIDHEGKFIIPARFKDAYTFSEGLALVQAENGKFGYINKKGEYIIPAIYKDAAAFSEGMAIVVKENEKLQCIDEKGEHVFWFAKNIEEANSFSEKKAATGFNDSYGYVDKTNQLRIAAEYSSASGFKEGLARVSIYDSAHQQPLFGFINESGKRIIDFQFDYADNFSEGLAEVSVDKKFGYIDVSGQYVINPQFDYASPFSGDYALIRIGNLFGFINKEGRAILKPQYKQADRFYDGLAIVSGENGRLGYIDKNGDFKISPQFDDASRFYGDIAIVGINKKFGVINREGQFIVKLQFEAIKLVPDNAHFIVADDVDLEGIISYITRGSTANSFWSLDTNTTYETLAATFPGLTENSYTSLEVKDDMGHPQIALQKVAFGFYGGILSYDGPATLFHNFGTDEYIFVPENTDEKGYLNLKAHLASADFFFKLRKKAFNKRKEVMAALFTKLKGSYGLQEATSSNYVADVYKLENDSYSVLFGLSEMDSHILEVSVHFKKE